jgi:hypothetical protein
MVGGGIFAEGGQCYAAFTIACYKGSIEIKGPMAEQLVLERGPEFDFEEI